VVALYKLRNFLATAPEDVRARLRENLFVSAVCAARSTVRICPL
jgi:hypothetical protein